MMSDGGLFFSTPDSQRDLERKQLEHHRGAEAYRLRGHKAVAAARKRQRQGRKAGRR